MNIVDILHLKFPNANFITDIVLRDHGDGIVRIADWNIEGVPRPSSQDLTTWEGELDLLYRQTQTVLKRNYPDIRDQLDMMYHDKINNTTVWQDTITAIKEANPKPTE